jgi:hypothetical protein
MCEDVVCLNSITVDICQINLGEFLASNFWEESTIGIMICRVSCTFLN